MPAGLPDSPAAREALRRVLSTAFEARDLADALLPLEAGLPALEAREAMAARGRRVAGLTRAGAWLGWVRLEDLEDLEAPGACGDCLRPFDSQPIIPEEAPLREVVLALGQADPTFVRCLGEVTAVVTSADLQEAPMRMWLFGLVTLSEFLMTRMIERRLPDGAWKPSLSAGRLERAETLQQERRRRGQEVPLYECLQFADKGDILLKYEPARALLGFESRRQGQEFFRRMESLRNSLAHSQPLPTDDLGLLVALAEGLDRLLDWAENPLPLAEADQLSSR